MCKASNGPTNRKETTEAIKPQAAAKPSALNRSRGPSGPVTSQPNDEVISIATPSANRLNQGYSPASLIQPRGVARESGQNRRSVEPPSQRATGMPVDIPQATPIRTARRAAGALRRSQPTANSSGPGGRTLTGSPCSQQRRSAANAAADP